MLNLKKRVVASHRGKQGFTLIELLVVIAIIALLAAILFPVFARARENARKTGCMNNMKQLSLGFLQYTQDYDETLPNVWNGPSGVNAPGGWMFYTAFDINGLTSAFDVKRGSVFPYVKSAQVYLCPSDTAGQKEGDSYGYNACLAGTPSGGLSLGKSLASVNNVSRFMLLGEESFTGLGSSTNDGFMAYGDPNTPRHLDGTNVSFVDGHVKFYRPEQIASMNLQTGGVTGGCP